MARISRRTVLQGTGGMAAILATGRAPAFAQEATVHWLRWNDFIPTSDEVLRKQIVPECKKALGIKVEFLMRFKDSPDPVPAGQCAPGSDDKIMHSAFRLGDSTVMASDGMAGGKPDFKGFSLSLDAKNERPSVLKYTALTLAAGIVAS